MKGRCFAARRPAACKLTYNSGFYLGGIDYADLKAGELAALEKEVQHATFFRDRHLCQHLPCYTGKPVRLAPVLPSRYAPARALVAFRASLTFIMDLVSTQLPLAGTLLQAVNQILRWRILILKTRQRSTHFLTGSLPTRSTRWALATSHPHHAFAGSGEA